LLARALAILLPGIAITVRRLPSAAADRRDRLHITHTVADVLRARMLAIGCGYPDGNDFDWLRCDPAFKLADASPIPVGTSARNRLADRPRGLD
jgi:hypothetical protein